MSPRSRKDAAEDVIKEAQQVRVELEQVVNRLEEFVKALETAVEHDFDKKGRQSWRS